MDKEVEVWKAIFEGLKFVIYNDYKNLTPEMQKIHGEIGTYVMNFLFGLKGYLNQHPDIKEALLKE